MGDDERVVQRSSPWATIAAFVALMAAVWVGTLLAGDSYPPPVMVGTFAVVLLLGHLFRRTVLGPHGVEIRTFRRRLIPWSEVTGVVVVGSRWNEGSITLRRPPDQPWVKLPAPVALFGMGTGHLHRAGDTVEASWVRHRH
jgi:hypothetical protein